jgi:hypothetical protein
MTHHPADRSGRAEQTGRLMAAVIFHLMLVNRTAVSSIRATPESVLRLVGLIMVEACAKTIRQRSAI